MYKGSLNLNHNNHIRGLHNFHDHPNRNPNNHQHDVGYVDDPAYATDEFRMYCFKIKQCPRTSVHDWTDCPFAHRGEKATRRDPLTFPYSGVPCPAYKSGRCPRGMSCDQAHGVFEFWLHPTSYRTRACKSGRSCQRKVCFFAHTQGELRSENEIFNLWLTGARAGAARKRVLGLRQGPFTGSTSRGYVGPPVRVDRGPYFEGVPEILDGFRGLRIRDEGGRDRATGLRQISSTINVGANRNYYMVNDALDLQNIDWVSDLVNEWD